jgi:hypothetical protein
LTPSCVHPKGGAASSALIFSNAENVAARSDFGKWFARDRRCVHEAAPIRYVAEFFGLETDSEKVILADRPDGPLLRLSRLPYGFGTAINHRLRKAIETVGAAGAALPAISSSGTALMVRDAPPPCPETVAIVGDLFELVFAVGHLRLGAGRDGLPAGIGLSRSGHRCAAA